MTDTQTTSGRLRILLVEDNALTRLGTATVIRTQPDFDLCGEAADGAAAIAQCRRLRPDVVVLDLNLPKLDGVAVAAELMRDEPPPRILVLTHYEGDESIMRSLRAGVLGYVTKEVPVEELIEAIRKVASGQRYLPGQIAAKLAERMTLPELSVRDLRVLHQLYRGLTNKQMGAALGITERSAAVYVSQVIGKLGVRTRQEAVAVAIDRGIVNPNEP